LIPKRRIYSGFVPVPIFFSALLIGGIPIASTRMLIANQDLLPSYGLSLPDALVLSLTFCRVTQIALVVAVVAFSRGIVWRDVLGMSPERTLFLAHIGLFATCTTVISILMTAAGRSIVDPVGITLVQHVSTFALILFVLDLFILAPTSEELICRGLCFARAKTVPAQATSAVFSSLVWAAWHWPANALLFLVYVSLGMILALARIHTNSLITPIAIHALQNIAALDMMLILIRS